MMAGNGLLGEMSLLLPLCMTSVSCSIDELQMVILAGPRYITAGSLLSISNSMDVFPMTVDADEVMQVDGLINLGILIP